MKVYFVASIIGRDEKSKEWQKLVVQAMKKQGLDVDTINLYTERKKLMNETEEDMLRAFKRNTKKIKDSDIVVAEVSVSDSGVGYEIAYAISLHKPVLALYNEEAIEPTAPPIQVGRQKLLTFAKYNRKNIGDVLKKFFKEVKNYLDTKFILIISPEIDRYLEWAAEYRRLHKAQIVRNALEKIMKNDKEYKKYLKETI